MNDKNIAAEAAEWQERQESIAQLLDGLDYNDHDLIRGYIGSQFDSFELLMQECKRLRALPAAGAAQPQQVACQHCGTHEVSLERTCHNSSCSAYAIAETVYEGWRAQAAPPAPQQAEAPDATAEELSIRVDVHDTAMEAAAKMAEDKSWTINPESGGVVLRKLAASIRACKSSPAAQPDAAEVRKQALEEALDACEEVGDEQEGDSAVQHGVHLAAAAIRALNDKKGG